MFSKSLLCVVLVSFCVPLTQAEPLSPGDVQALLGRIREKRAAAPQVRADFQEEKTMRMMNKPVTSAGQVWFQAPNKFRREVKGSSPSTTISDGQQLWIYYPKFQSAEHYSLGKRSPLDAGIAAITASLNLEGVEQTYNIAGSKEGSSYALQLTPRVAALKKMLQQLSIHFNDTLQVTRTEIVQLNGDRLVTAYTGESRAPIDPAMFVFTPPAGTNVTTPLGR
ncbi:MAG TPA: outer membrane lipoprotein carrier protein LolA [Chthoniobacterales bacterium]|nr:outer membrane lipoprotein carrier protein LolA [Chthoniobacterales bacterium]